MVLSAELFNTAIETIVDMITEEKNEKAKKIDYYNSQKEHYVKTLAEKEDELAKIIETLTDEELKIENIKSEIIDNLNEISDKKATLNGLSTMLTNISNRKSQVMKELADIISLESGFKISKSGTSTKIQSSVFVKNTG